ncbi:MAG TPA: DEAD/DEAH box helicase [Dongiaceae bacterium]|nr:DEAD/DEAH box helicase [Dongiaceae bacterium]
MPFSKLPLHPDLQRAIKEMGFLRPTPIQEAAIPPAVEGRDLLACAMTGSGKTAAFLLPILNRLASKPRGMTRALVLTPTRELAAQILEHLEELAVHSPVTGAAVFGGTGMAPQEHALRSGVDVIIATPGRLLDHMSRPYTRLGGLEVLVLDETDRMLDMGFLPDIRRILKALPSRRQTLLFSATIPQAIAQIARDLMRDPVTINMERKSKPAVGIRQAVYPVGRDLKAPLLRELLARKLVVDAIVFTRTKHRADRLTRFLEQHGVAAGRIHGNRSQAQRTAALEGFKSGRHKILVATDIVSRGIDVEALGHVINFDVPADPDSYIHRVGRTARAELTGDAFTLVAPDEESDLRAIEKVLGQPLPRVTLPGFDYAARPIGMPQTRQPGHRGQPRGHGHAPAHRRAAHGGHGGGHAGGGHSGGGGHAHGQRRGNGGGHRQNRGQNDARLQAILDKHAPAPAGDAGRSARPGPRRRFR